MFEPGGPAIGVDRLQPVTDVACPAVDQRAPDGITALFVDSVDLGGVSGADAVRVLKAAQRLASHYQARMYEAMAAISRNLDEGGDAIEDLLLRAEGEIRPALTWTRRRTEEELAFAQRLSSRLPRVFSALRAGLIDVPKAKAMDRATIHLQPSVAQALIEQVIDDAPDLTTGQLSGRLGKIVANHDPDEAKDRYHAAHQDRRVVIERTDAGTANFHAFDIAPDDAASLSRRLSVLSMQTSTPDDPRSTDQRKADLAVELMMDRPLTRFGAPNKHDGASRSGTATGQRGSGSTVTLYVDLDTLAGLNDNSAELAGFGPVIADIARKVAAESAVAEWRYRVTDPLTGKAVAAGTTRRRPTAAQCRDITDRHTTCVFSGCRMPSTESDLDHRIEFAETGVTDPNDMAPLCRHDHRIKGTQGFTYVLNPDGSVTWTTPLRQRYTIHPDGRTTEGPAP
ncbi:MAG: DUF222 domain-containing protein [Acidimicrobiia bacterium]